MTIRFLISVLWLAWAAAQAGQATAEKCTMKGTVADANGGESLRKVTVELAPWSGGGVNRRTTTGGDGHFAFTEISPGEYWLHGQGAGYLEGSLGSRRMDSKGTLLRLKAGDALTDVELKLTRMAVISGKVTDSAGDPLGGLLVKAYLATWLRGHRQFAARGYGHANDGGEYRISGLAAGRYYLYVEPGQSAYVEEQGKPEKRLLTAFYPDAPTTATAMLVEVAAGQHTAGVNFRVRAAETFAVRGRITVRPKSGAELTIVAAREGVDREDWAAGEAEVKADGTFAMQGLPSGVYNLQSIRAETGAEGGVRTRIEIKGADVSGVVIPVFTALEISGTIRFEGGANRIVGDTIQLLKADTGTSPNVFLTVQDDGTFHGRVTPGRYVVDLPTLPGDGYVKSIVYGGQDVLGQVIDFAQGMAGDFVISVVRGAGRVEGSVTVASADDGSAAKETVRGARVALVSDRARFDSAGVFFEELDQAGHFAFGRVPPGKYYAFATRDTAQGLWQNRDFFGQMRGSGVAVNVAERGNVHIEAPLLAAGDVERALAAIGQ